MQSGSESEDDGLIEQVPACNIQRSDDGSGERVLLTVPLPGVESSAGLQAKIWKGGRRVLVHLPGKYRLDAPLPVEVEEKALKLRFVKNKQTLKAEYAVVAGGNESSSPPSEAAATDEPPAGPTRASRVAAAAPAPVSAQQSSFEAGTLHDSFMQDALKLQKAHVKTNRKGSRSVKADGMPNGHASTRPQSAGSAARADPSPSSVAPPAASPSERTASSNPTAEEDSQSHLQQHLSSTAASSKSKLQHQAPPDSDIMPVPDSHGLNGLPGGADAVAWVKEATGVGSDQRPSMNGKAHDRGASQADSSTLYEAAKAHGNREAAAECSAKAGEALEAGDYDKAERLYAKAERLAPGVHTDEAAKAAAQRAEYEEWAAEQAREAKRRKREAEREAEKRKREAERRRKQQEQQAEERARAEAAARAEAEGQDASDGDHSGTWDDWSEEPGSARSQAQEPSPEPSQWKRALYPLNWVMSIMYTRLSRVLHMMGAHGAVAYLQGLRVGTGPQQAFLAAGVLMVWALFLRLAIALTWWIVPIVWMIWCAVFWRPSLTAAIIEFVSAVCLLSFMNNMVGDLISLPLMWYWVGGGFTALLGTLWCFGSLFLLMDPRHVERRGWAWLYNWAMPLHVLSPVMYTLLARWTGWYGQVPVLAFSLWRFWDLLTTPLPKKDLPPGMAGTPSCKAEPVPDGAAPEVAKVLRAASWYEVLEVAVSATTEEIKRAHKVKSLGTHPDKVGAAKSGSHEASIRVNMAREVLLNEDKRRAYDAEVRAAASGAYAADGDGAGAPPRRTSSAGTASRSPEEEFREFHGYRVPCTKVDEHNNSDCVCMPCQWCPLWHHVYVSKRPRTAAYQCQDCHRPHMAMGRMFWMESGYGTMLGFTSSYKYYMHLNGIILDITDVAQTCAVWSFLHKRCPAARCSEILTFKGGVLPVREECFAAHTNVSEPSYAYTSRPTGTPRNNKRKGRRRR